MKISQSGTVFDGSKDKNISSCTFPGLCELGSGRILVSFKGSPRKVPFNTGECGYTCISDDGAKTFSQPIKMFEPPVVNGKPTTIRTLYYLGLENNRVLAVFNAVDAGCEELPYYNEKTEGIKDTYIMYALSEDGAQTFSEPMLFESKLFGSVPFPLTGPPCLLDDGSIALQFEVNKRYDDRNTLGPQLRSGLLKRRRQDVAERNADNARPGRILLGSAPLLHRRKQPLRPLLELRAEKSAVHKHTRRQKR